jgi:2-oxo-4-hydroxy-4-carboxy-5-ureidoimidazoline decarboxylase
VNLSDLNTLGREAFVDALGWVFEDSPWVAERVWPGRPFASLERLHETMTAVVFAASADRQLALLRAHPDLGARLKMSAASNGEQAGAGLDQLAPDVFTRLQMLTAEYRQKFGFPFLFAVKGSTPAQILDALEVRLPRDRATEFEEALRQVARIAWFRLDSMITR